MPERSLGLRKAVEGEGIPREGRERDAHVARGGSRAPGRQLEQAELDARPGVCLVLTDRCRRRELHRARRAGCVAEQLARVRDARVRRDARLERCHPIERGERLRVVTELDLGVADDAVDARGRRRDRPRAEAERERPAKLVAGKRELPEARGRDQVARLHGERLVQDAVGLRVVRRVAGLADALQVRQTERLERLHVARAQPKLALEAGDLRLGVAGGEAALQLLGDAGRQPVGCRGGAPGPEGAAEGEDGGGQHRRRPCDQYASPHPTSASG